LQDGGRGQLTASFLLVAGERIPPMTAIEFIQGLTASAIPADVRHAATRALLDTIGVAAAATATNNSRIVRDFASAMFGATGGSGARLMFDGRSVSLPGAGFGNAGSIDSLDAHDGQKLTKGHMGVVVVPAMFAFAATVGEVSGEEFMTQLVLGYEIATRAGIALHATACDYHTSGAWNALAAAAIGARTLGLDEQWTRHALGIAEYNGPRSQMMRCIDHPTMLKDGATWGGFTGISAALLARMGHTGAPAITMEAPDVAQLWADLGRRWYTADQYIKLYPVCRWAQPAIAAALSLSSEFDIADIAGIRIETFHEAKRLPLAEPANSEEAQYSIKFPVAAALARGRIGVEEVTGAGLKDPATIRLARMIEVTEDDEANAAFPADRLARVIVRLKDGRELRSGMTRAVGDPDVPLSDAALIEKFEGLTVPALGRDRADRLREACLGLWQAPSLTTLTGLVMPPAASPA
jgi:2-methylcitrate dehydratase PrpD